MGNIEFVGADGCVAGWCAVGLDRGDSFECKVFATFKELLAYFGDAKLILVDIPIGMRDCRCPRECDTYARKELYPRSSSVFPVPTRKTLNVIVGATTDYKTTYKNAKAVKHDCLECSKTTLTTQTFSISLKVAEVDEVIVARKRIAKPCVREVHPELCFWALHGTQSMRYSKKCPKGRDERIGVLKEYNQHSQEMFDQARDKYKYLGKGLADDDLVDALVAAVTARLVCTKPSGLPTVPHKPPKDAKGLPMEMVYWLPKQARPA